MEMLRLMPCEGVDYSSRTEVLTAFLRGDSFRAPDGRVETRASVEARGQTTVTVSYASMSRLVDLHRAGDAWTVLA